MDHDIASPVHRDLISEGERTKVAAERFGTQFTWFESFVFDSAGSLSDQYSGGFWDFYRLSNGGFYMAPSSPERLKVVCENGYEGELSADAFGITACLYAYSLLSFSANAELGEVCARNYHRLRQYMLEHTEVNAILSAID